VAILPRTSGSSSLDRPAARRLIALVGRVFFFVFFAAPAFADGLEGENTFCVLLGLTLIGVLGGWALLFGSTARDQPPTDAGLVVVAAPALFLSVVVFFPAAERLVLVMPALPLIVATGLRVYYGVYYNSRPRALPSAPNRARENPDLEP